MRMFYNGPNDEILSQKHLLSLLSILFILFVEKFLLSDKLFSLFVQSQQIFVFILLIVS
jgi:hypothetical protein